jgi:tetratricopeptide (TPR) repeat protein
VAEAEGIGAAVNPAEGEDQSTEGSGVDAAGMALALDAAHHDPKLAPAVRRYLDRQRALVDLQIKHFDEEHTLAIAAARRKGLLDRLRISLQVLVAAVVAAVVVAIALMLLDAINDRGVVIDAISVPEDLAQRGFTGETVAKHILDRLAEINAASGTIRAANSYSNSLGGGIKLEIPETGISIGELSRVVHERLGHTTHVTGEITHSGEALTIRIRVGDEYEAESTGPEASLPDLVKDASTRIYAQTQPYRYGFWLYTLADYPAAAAVFRDLAATGPLIERVWALHGLAIVADTPRDSIRFDRQVLQQDPGFFLSHMTIAQVEYLQGHEEAGLKEIGEVLSAPAAESGLSAHGVAQLRADAASLRDVALGDYAGAVADDTTVATLSDRRPERVSEWRVVAADLARLHDFSAASGILDRLPSSDSGESKSGPSPMGSAPSPSQESVRMTGTRSILLAESGDWRGALAGLERVEVASRDLHGGRQTESFRTAMYPWLAEAYAHVGRDADADAVLAQLPPDVYDGWRARGRIAMLRHDYTGADKAFAEAVRQGPSIPRAYLDWGDMLAARGDLEGAIAKYTEANRLGPHWADPLKGWGDVLTRQGHARDALRKYRQALPHAPHWVELEALVDAGSRG